jgi:hypothetical protein
MSTDTKCPGRSVATTFEVGQKWLDRSGDIWKITNICTDEGDVYSIYVINEKNRDTDCFTAQGRCWALQATEEDLVDLVPTPKKTINFWEARQAALDGKKVRRIGFTLLYSTEDFTDHLNWDNNSINAAWEIVEEPKHKTCYINVYLHNMCPWGAHETRVLADSSACTDRASCLAITVDENGKLVEARNI